MLFNGKHLVCQHSATVNIWWSIFLVFMITWRFNVRAWERDNVYDFPKMYHAMLTFFYILCNILFWYRLNYPGLKRLGIFMAKIVAPSLNLTWVHFVLVWQDGTKNIRQILSPYKRDEINNKKISLYHFLNATSRHWRHVSLINRTL